MVLWKADRVPLKPNISNINLPQRYRDAIRASPESLSNFYPTGIHPENIGSNIGLLKIVKQFSIDKGIQNETSTRYHAVTADMNIHRRIIQVFSQCSTLVTDINIWCYHTILMHMSYALEELNVTNVIINDFS